MSGKKDVNLLLVGRTGNGKSATGNSILGQKVFHASMNSEPFAEADIRLETRADGHPHISVVDGPGIGDASLNDPKGVQTTISLTLKALEKCPGGFSAVLLVLKYGERFTAQEKDAIRMLKGILGSSVLESHGVVVMTRGDSFENDQEEDSMCFEDWCERQTGDVAAIFQECKRRFVLFDNRTKIAAKLDEQRRKLLDQVYKLGRYTMQDYVRAEDDRRRLKLASEFDSMEKETRAFVDKTTAAINELDISRNPNDAKDKITALQGKLNTYRQKLQEETKGTDVATGLLLQLDILGFSLGNKLEMANRTLELQEKATQDRRKQREKGTSRKSRNKEIIHKQSDAIEGHPQNYDTRASGSRGNRSIRHTNQEEAGDKLRDNTAATHHNEARKRSNRQVQTRAESDDEITASDHKHRKHISSCCTLL